MTKPVLQQKWFHGDNLSTPEVLLAKIGENRTDLPKAERAIMWIRTDEKGYEVHVEARGNLLQRIGRIIYLFFQPNVTADIAKIYQTLRQSEVPPQNEGESLKDFHRRLLNTLCESPSSSKISPEPPKAASPQPSEPPKDPSSKTPSEPPKADSSSKKPSEPPAPSSQRSPPPSGAGSGVEEATNQVTAVNRLVVKFLEQRVEKVWKLNMCQRVEYVQRGEQVPWDLFSSTRKAVLLANNIAWWFGVWCRKGSAISLDKTIPSTSLFDVDNPGTALAPPPHKKQTTFRLVVEDTITAALTMSAPDKRPPCLLNMANNGYPGGGYKDAAAAQEEALCRSAPHLYYALLEAQRRGLYPINQPGTAKALYTGMVPLLRQGEPHGYQPLETPCSASFVSCALFDLRTGSQDRVYLGLTGSLTEQTLRASRKYMDETRKRVRALLGAAKAQGETRLVLGAIGCGAFENPPRVVADIFKKVFQEPDFQGAFEEVCFAVLDIFPNDHLNIDAFGKLCTTLNQPPAKGQS